MGNFWTGTAYEKADALRKRFLDFSSVQASRRGMAEVYAACTEGMQLTHLGPYGYTYETDCPRLGFENIPLIRNTAHELVDTLTSKIGAIDPPLPAMLTSKGNWKDRRQASDLELLVRAEYADRKGMHPTLHSVWIAALRLAAGATGAAVVQYFNDNGKVGARIHDTLGMFWSPDLRVQGVVTWLPIEDAKELYPDAAELLDSCVGEPPDEWKIPLRDGQKLTDFVCIYEGWRGADAQGKNGIHVVCVKNGEAILTEKYTSQKPPLVWLVCIPHMYGVLGHSMLHHVFESMKRDNLVLSRVDRAINKTNESTTYAARNMFLEGENAMTVTEDHKVVWLADAATPPPTTVSPPGFAAEHLTVADRHYADTHAVSGLSEAVSGGERQEGIDSAIGQRYVAALVNERFAGLQRRYVQAVAVDSAEIIIQILCEIYRDDPKMMRLSPANDTLKEICGSVALKGIEQLKYIVQPAAVSGNKGNPADRMQSAFEMKQLGILDDNAFAAMQDNGEDLQAIMARRDAVYTFVEEQISRWTFASDEDVAKPDFYIPPIEQMGDRVGAALLQTVDAYLEAIVEKLEPERLDFFMIFMADCGAMAPAPPAGPSPAPPPVPGAPPPPSAMPPPTPPAPPQLAAA